MCINDADHPSLLHVCSYCLYNVYSISAITHVEQFCRRKGIPKMGPGGGGLTETTPVQIGYSVTLDTNISRTPPTLVPTPVAMFWSTTAFGMDMGLPSNLSQLHTSATQQATAPACRHGKPPLSFSHMRVTRPCLEMTAASPVAKDNCALQTPTSR